MVYFRLTLRARQRLREIGRDTQKTWGVDQRNKYLTELDKGFYDLAARPDKGRARRELALDLFLSSQEPRRLLLRPIRPHSDSRHSA